MAGREELLSVIPEPSWQQIQALDRTVESVVSSRGLSWAEVTQHRTAVGKLQTFVRKFLDGVRLEMFGAVNGGSALKEDAVSVSVSGNGSAHSLLVQVLYILHRHGAPEYKNVHEDFSGKGYVKAEEVESGRQFVLVVSGHSDIAAGQLFHLYFSADSRAHELAVMLRSWAQKCHLDRPEEGTLPAHAFDIMVIYFLQQITPPVLPVLQFPADAQKWLSVSDIVQQLNSQAERWWSDNRSGLGELWLQLLKFYCCQFHFACSVVSVRTKAQPTHKRWSTKRVAIEEEEEASSEGIKCVCACKALEEDMFHYDMFSSYFKNEEKPEVTCGLCKMTGHIRASCMEKKAPTILPSPTEQHLVLVNNIITNILYDFTPIESDVENRALVVEEVKRPVESVFPEASVEVFGSTMSGFGFFSSDLDICVNFGGEDEKENDESRLTKKRLQKVAGIMFRLKTFTNIQVIASARVPIIKLRHIETQVDLDISIDNCLAIHNTRLLRCYSKIDERVRILGLAVKVFAKACEINDASLGSLSSYTYILMMLHYLQQCQPPVIPVLQELYPGGKKPETKQFMVSGCNVWFFDDLKRLPKVWAGCGQNGQSVGELWLGFLRYYVNHFDWKNTAVSIRQPQLLTKFEKRWTGPCLAVEDPFDLNRNLGRNLALWVNDCIFYTFQCGALHFWTPLDANKKQFERFESLSDYFFDMDLLTGGSIASESYCPACHERGHTFRVCPEQSFLPGQKTACHWFILLLCRRRKDKKKKEAPVNKEQPGKQAGKKGATTGKAAQATGASKNGNKKLAAPDTKVRKKTKSSADRPKTSEQTESSNPEATVKQRKSRKQAKPAVNKSKACEDNASSRPQMTVDNGKTGKKTKSSDDRPRSGTAKLGSPQASPHKQKTPNKTKSAGAAPETCEQPESGGVGLPPPVKQKTPKKSKSAGAAPETCEQPESGGVGLPPPVKQKTPKKSKSAGAAPETCEQPESGGVGLPPPVKQKTPKKSKSAGAAPETCKQPESGGVGLPPPVKQKTPKKSKSAGAAPETCEQPESGGVGSPPPVKQKTPKKSKSAGDRTCPQTESGASPSPLHAQSGDKGPVAKVYFALGDSGDYAHMVESDIVQIAGAKARILVKPSKWE